MGKPPPHMIFRRVVKNYFKKSMPEMLEETIRAEENLYSCWDKHGTSAEACKRFEQVYEEAMGHEMRYQKYLRTLNYPKKIMQHLAPAVRKMEGKGKNQSKFIFESKPRFDLVGFDLSKYKL